MENNTNKTPQEPKGDELDPFFLDIVESYALDGNLRLGELQDKIEAYIDSRIDAKLKQLVSWNQN